MQEPPVRRGIPLPLARPVVTYVLLGVIGIVFLVEVVLIFSLTGSLNEAITQSGFGSGPDAVMAFLGAQINSQIANQGEYWRLITPMFLHFGLLHLLFNAWALFSLGREVESLYGSARFTAIYFLAGLFGNLAFYLFGPANELSAGASGAIFGLVGADIAFFLRNRRLLGNLGRRQLGNLLFLVVINLAILGRMPGINNIAHMGGLVSGFLLGFGLSPHYAVSWDGLTPSPQLVDRTSPGRQLSIFLLGTFLLLVGVRLGTQWWVARSGSQSLAPSSISAVIDLVPQERLPRG
jgi:rhomboid protease GluP